MSWENKAYSLQTRSRPFNSANLIRDVILNNFGKQNNTTSVELTPLLLG